MKIPKKFLTRQHEITADFLREVDNHLKDILSGDKDQMFEIRDFAALLYIHPIHLSNTIKAATGHSPCYFMENRLMEISKSLLQIDKMPISEVARTLTYDPSNFTKFFKRFSGKTPKQYRTDYFQSLPSKEDKIAI
ncbi:DNA-binding transcriptional regulator AraC [compost metagenome]|jgi:AraC family transcriptional regulator of adaptative response / methylphosphotriester-DNA alkyltransferase methyltransferase